MLNRLEICWDWLHVCEWLRDASRRLQPNFLFYISDYSYFGSVIDIDKEMILAVLKAFLCPSIFYADLFAPDRSFISLE